MDKKSLLVFLLYTLHIIHYTSICYAGFSRDSAGTASAQFLKIPVGARAVALGETYGAISDDAYAMYWNPAGLGQLKQKNLNFTYNMWLEKISHSFLAYAHPFKFGTFGLSVNQLSIPPIDKYDKYGYQAAEKTYRASDMAINIGYGKEIVENTLAGLNAKFIRSNIDGTTASPAFAIDFGILYSREKQSFCAVIQNLGTKIKFVTQEDPLPTNIKLGTAYKLIPERLLIAVDLNIPADNELRLNLGTEYTIKFSRALSIAGRFGAKTNVRGLDPISAISLGLGVNWALLNLDFAWVPYGLLGNTIRISLGLKFGRIKPEIKEAPKPK